MTVPVMSVVSPRMEDSSVDLPLPTCPTTATSEPALTLRSTAVNAAAAKPSSATVAVWLASQAKVPPRTAMASLSPPLGFANGPSMRFTYLWCGVVWCEWRACSVWVLVLYSLIALMEGEKVDNAAQGDVALDDKVGRVDKNVERELHNVKQREA